MQGKLLVIGSSNIDMVIKAPKFPLPGETVLGNNFLMNPGGKGANQAVAAARLGAHVTFIAKLGNDVFGRQAMQQFQREAIDTRHLTMDPENPSGVALINVDGRGEYCISVAPGANNFLKPKDVEAALEAADPDTIVLLQLEIPLETAEYVIRESNKRGLRVLLNPAPVQTLLPELFKQLYMITPNGMDAELLTGIRITDTESARLAAIKLQAMGVPNVIVTLDERGAYVQTDTISRFIEAPVVKAIDTMAVDNCFNGALAVALSEGQPLEEAVVFACKVASISVTRMGCQSSFPYRKELEAAPVSVPKKMPVQKKKKLTGSYYS